MSNYFIYKDEKPLINFDNFEYELIQLGTGISQIFPILFECLLTPPMSTIIIEEPELNLHPKIQSRLADFFIAMSLSGRQCLIATHSEYIIEQLRYRIVNLTKIVKLHEKTKLYFVSKHNGISYFNNIEINEYADLSDWPDDFFDESHLNKLNLMKARQKKEDSDKKND